MPASLRKTADSLLEATVVASWTRCGIAARRRLFDLSPPRPGSLEGRSFLVTGGTRGIGRAAAVSLLRAGASVGVVGRDEHQSAQAARGIAAEVGGSPADAVWSEGADIGSVADVERLAERVSGRLDRLDGIVHAAGVLTHEYSTSPEGTELTAATHVVGSHLLTSRLVPLLELAPSAAVVWVSSGGMYLARLDVAALDSSEEFRGALAYARAKRAQVELAHLWARRLEGRGVAAVAMHPGWVDTGALRHGLPVFASVVRPLLRTAEDGADTAVWLVAGGAGPNPPAALWLDRRRRGEVRWPRTRTATAERERLWTWCEERSRPRVAP